MKITCKFTKIPFSNKKYLVDENGKQLTGAFFDNVDIYNNFVVYKINGRFNAVTYNFVKAHSEKKDYLEDCTYRFFHTFENYIVLFNIPNKEITILNKDGYLTRFNNVVDWVEYKNYFIIKLSDSQYQMIYPKDDSWDCEYIENLSPDFYIAVFNFSDSYVYEWIKERSDLDKILKFLKVLLKEDIRNYSNKYINKFYLRDNKVQYDYISYNSIEKATEEAKKVLSFVKNKFLEKIKEKEKARAEAEYRQTHKKEIEEQIEKAGEELDALTEDLNAGV